VILRSITKHVRDQNWFAVGIDFVIVVVGVFIGIQVANWNEAQAERARELLLLGELHAELANSIRQTEIKLRAFEQISRSGQRALAFLDSDTSCADDCWNELVHFFHASQWQRLLFELPTYDEMRRNGWPRNRAIVEAVEAFRRQAVQIAVPLEDPPAYRNLVRGLIPLAAHQPYWQNCFQLVNGEETYLETCPPGVPPAVSAAAIRAIRAHPEIRPTLTQWAGFAGGYTQSLNGQNSAAQRALELINAELAARQ